MTVATQVPTLVMEGNRPIFGSQVICQYLNSQASPDKKLLPGEGDPTRYDELVLESLADSLLDAALLYRYEITARVRPSRHGCTLADFELIASPIARAVEMARVD